MRIVTSSIPRSSIDAMASAEFGDLVKAVVDVERSVMALDAGMHADLEALLLDDGSRNGDLWGINLYPADFGSSEFIEFDALINIRPLVGNRSRGVDDAAIRDAITALVRRLVAP